MNGPYLVWCFVDDRGKYQVQIIEVYDHNKEKLKEWVKHLSRFYPEWQCSDHADLGEVKSCLMSAYGIGWFNRARRKLRELGAFKEVK
jgi:hypothetical protein